MAKKPNLAKTLRETIAMYKRLSRIAPPKDFDWSDKSKRSEAANEALTLRYLSVMKLGLLADRNEIPIGKAFKAFGMNHKNPDDWRDLLGFFAMIHFPQTPAEQRYQEISFKFFEVRLTTKNRQRAIEAVREHFKTTVRTVEKALAWHKEFFGPSTEAKKRASASVKRTVH
jgi:hypothetical protein